MSEKGTARPVPWAMIHDDEGGFAVINLVSSHFDLRPEGVSHETLLKKH